MPVLSSAISVGHLHDVQLYGGVVTTLKSVSDAILLTDAAPGILVRLTMTDTLHGSDALTIKAFLTITDVLHLAEAVTVKTFLTVADGVTLADVVSPKHLIAIVDVLHVVEGIAIAQYFFLTVKDRIRLDDGAQANPRGNRPWYPLHGP